MKKELLIYAFMLLMPLLAKAVENREPYVTLSADNKTLTFYYDNQKESRDGIDIKQLIKGYNSRPWNSHASEITTVVFDNTFANCDAVTSTSYWFDDCKNLTTITGLEHLNTTNVTYMSGMFCNCSSLKSIDLSSFSTSKVTSMTNMFAGCTMLETLDLSHFNTSNVTNMSLMFERCSSLRSVDISHFETAKVEDLSSMFWGCSSLTSVDVSNFETGNLKTTSGMFHFCSSLETIYADYAWTCSQNSNEMFLGCTSLRGAVGYNESMTDITGANPTTGYFTPSGRPHPHPYATISEDHTTLTFYYDEAKATRDNVLDISPAPSMTFISWKDYKPDITTVVFDESFARYTELTSMESWFYNCSKLTTFIGIEHLNTAKVVSMYGLFTECSSLTSIDLRNFDVSSLVNTEVMFSHCSALTTIYCDEKWECEYSDGMFSLCYALEGAVKYDGTKSNDILFADPQSGYFYSNKVPLLYTTLSEDNKTLTFYYDGQKKERNGSALTSFGTYMPYRFRSWNDYATEIETVVFDESLANCHELESTAWWFYGCSNLKTITGLEYLDTQSVTDMQEMFYNCSSLVTLDLRHFNTSNVKTMDMMFSNCSSLTTIYCDDAWTCESSGNMFYRCESLVGVIRCVSGKTDVTYANPFTGYFTSDKVPVPYTVMSEENTILTFYYDNQRMERGGQMLIMQGNMNTCNWGDYVSDITTVVFDPSFASLKGLTRTASWFCGCENLTTISGLKYLNTAQVTDMSAMFSACCSLQSLDLSHFDTHEVTNMEYMFEACNELETIYVGDKWTTDKVEYGDGMFSDCYKLVGGQGTSFEVESEESDDPFGLTYARIDGGKEAPGYLTYKNGIELEPLEGETVITVEDLLSDGTETENVVVNNIYVNLTGDDDGYNEEEECVVINTQTDMTDISDATPGSADIQEKFSGLIVEVNGKGCVKVDCQTQGTQVLMVKIGTEDPVVATQSTRGVVQVDYDVTEPTYVYIYASAASEAPAYAGNAKRVAAKENSVKIYSLTVVSEVKPYTLGDVNNDGKVDMKDVVCIVNYLLHPADGGISVERADMNHDSRVTITDAVMLLTSLP